MEYAEEPLGMGSLHTHPAVLVVLFALIAYFPLFLNLDVLPLRIWDESRTAVSAYEMYRSGNLLVPHFQGEPDMWGVKPPLVIWFQVLFMHIIGPGELAVRLPSALAALLTGILIFQFSWRDLGRPWLGLFTCGVLYSSQGFINTHAARSGDHDALMTLFMVASLITLFRWCEYGRRKDLLIFFVLMGAGALTKSIQALLFLPGIAAYLILRKRSIAMLKQPYTYLGIGVFLTMIAAYYLKRESVNPGYLEAVWENELWGRYAGTLEGHRQPWDHYITLLIDRDLSSWYLLVPVGVVLGLLQKDQRMYRWVGLVSITALGYLIVISTSGTKLDWYVAPLMPLLAVLVAVALHMFLLSVLSISVFSTVLRSIRPIPFLLLFLLFAQPWSRIVSKNYYSRESPWDVEFYRLSHYLKQAVGGKHPVGADLLVRQHVDQHLLFYIYLLKDQGIPIELLPKESITAGMKVLLDEHEVEQYIQDNFDHSVSMIQDNLRIHEVHARRN